MKNRNKNLRHLVTSYAAYNDTVERRQGEASLEHPVVKELQEAQRMLHRSADKLAIHRLQRQVREQSQARRRMIGTKQELARLKPHE